MTVDFVFVPITFHMHRNIKKGNKHTNTRILFKHKHSARVFSFFHTNSYTHYKNFAPAKFSRPRFVTSLMHQPITKLLLFICTVSLNCKTSPSNQNLKTFHTSAMTWLLINITRKKEKNLLLFLFQFLRRLVLVEVGVLGFRPKCTIIITDEKVPFYCNL